MVATARNVRHSIEVLFLEDPKARNVRHGVDVLFQEEAKARVTRHSIEVLFGMDPTARDYRYSLEVLVEEFFRIDDLFLDASNQVFTDQIGFQITDLFLASTSQVFTDNVGIISDLFLASTSQVFQDVIGKIIADEFLASTSQVFTDAVYLALIDIDPYWLYHLVRDRSTEPARIGIQPVKEAQAWPEGTPEFKEWISDPFRYNLPHEQTVWNAITIVWNTMKEDPATAAVKTEMNKWLGVYGFRKADGTRMGT